ncbi:GNAT family N-acetyltransferase [Arthrobacter sp. CAN_C5]|uniref:GNAT family N-acetyltransferase n=1 Tax=Arthrobacter sp. CAN_C5 TaxID=2760706 RepID=UPI001AE5FE0D|nr:GNAT family N-acetyltransferase [Arthrobacter sp. CAN_C5]MBP2216374.1 GNAT superfamily N-acetyltransferase [Arthrobacter sp. CAN_C5]
MISIRAAGRLDITFLPAIEAAADSLLTSINGLPLQVPLPDGASRTELAASLKLLVAGTPCIGFARLEELDGAAHLEQLAVLPRHAGRGTGRALVEASKAWARDHGYPTMTLSTFADVPFNAPFYATCGFEAIPVLSPALLDLQRYETALGLDRIGRRVIMRAVL